MVRKMKNFIPLTERPEAEILVKEEGDFKRKRLFLKEDVIECSRKFKKIIRELINDSYKKKIILPNTKDRQIFYKTFYEGLDTSLKIFKECFGKVK